MARPTKYKPEYAEQAKNLCKLGATDVEVADALKVDVATVYRWQNKYPGFCEALKVGKETANERAKRALYHRAIGYSHEAVKVMQYKGKPVIVPYIERFPPDPASLNLWLKNRCPDEFRDRQESVNVNMDVKSVVVELVSRIGTGKAQELLEAVAPNLLAQMPVTIEGERA